MIKHEPITSCSLILTEGCNLNCTYCFEKDKNHKAVMSKETARQSIDFLVKEAVDYNKDHISITYFGGEPLLNLDTLKDSFDYAVAETKKNNLAFDCLIITNGTIITDEYKAFLLHWNNTLGQVRVQVSIDGIPDIQNKNRVNHSGEGTSHIVESAVAEYVKFFDENNISKENFSVHSVMTKDSIKVMAESYAYFKSLGIDNIWNMPLHEEEWNDEDVVIFEEQLRIISDNIYEACKEAGTDKPFRQYSSIARCTTKRPDKPCSAGCNFITITTDGKFYPCHHFYFSDKELCLGSLEEGIIDDRRLLFVEYGFDNCFGDQSCESCDNKACYTCIAANYANNGNLLIGFPGYCKLSRMEDTIRRELSVRLEKLGVHKSIYSNGLNKKSIGNSSKSCKCGDKDHECECGSGSKEFAEVVKNVDNLLEEILSDREFLKESVKLMDNNIVTLDEKINQLNDKVDSLLDVVTLLSQFIVAQAGGTSKDGDK